MCLPLFGGDHSTQACVQGWDYLDKVARQVVMPQSTGDTVVVYGSKRICQIQPAYSDVALASCIKDGLLQLELLCSLHPETPSTKAFLCCCVDVVVLSHETHEIFLENTSVHRTSGLLKYGNLSACKKEEND